MNTSTHRAAGIDTSGIPCDGCDEDQAGTAGTGAQMRELLEQQRRNVDAMGALSSQVSGLSVAVGAIVQRLDEGAKRMDAMQAELRANTALTKTVSDASTFVRVGTSVAKWLGIIAIALGSIVVGVKMATGSAGLPADAGIGPK